MYFFWRQSLKNSDPVYKSSGIDVDLFLLMHVIGSSNNSVFPRKDALLRISQLALYNMHTAALYSKLFVCFLVLPVLQTTNSFWM